jgi:Type II restriction enzyme MunI
MGSKENRLRQKWQDYSSSNAGLAEKSFLQVFVKEFEGTAFQIRAKPKDFSNVYVDVELGNHHIAEIYTPNNPVTKHGVVPDYAIDNADTKKTLYVEVKRQDGWIEGGKRSDGRGNAHERSNKFFTPGLLKILRSKGNLGDEVLPFWTVFQGNITRDPCRVREITCWYDEFDAHYYFWRDQKNPVPLIHHFNSRLKPLML